MGQHERELNPYWKDGGSGLPSDCRSEERLSEPAEVPRLGDGGSSWIQKAFERAKQQAIDQGRDLEEIVAERWGSVEKLNALLNAADRGRSSTASSDRKRSNRQGWRKGGSDTRPDQDDKRGDSRKPMSVDRPQATTRTTSAESDRQMSSATISYQKNDKQVPSDLHSKSTSGRSRGESPPASSSDDDPESEDEESSAGSDKDDLEIIEFKLLSTQEMNKLGAKIMKAELMGDDELASKLKKELEANQKVIEARKKEGKPVGEGKSSEPEEVILMQSDKHGNLYPMTLKEEQDIGRKGKKRRKVKKIITHDAEGKRVRYFENEDDIDIKTMYQQEKLSDVSAQERDMMKLASKFTRSSDDYGLDDFYEEGAAVTGSERKNEAYRKKQAIKAHQEREKAVKDCQYCFSGAKNAKHLIVAMAIKTYLTLPAHSSLTEGHCKLVPMEHVMAATYADEDVLGELQNFKQSLVDMFKGMDMDVIFLETFKNTRGKHHMVLDCIPVPQESGDMAPIYFKKAILESETEWSQNRKLVDIKKQYGIRKAIPTGLPYFAVEFGMDGGYAHVIEEVESFPSHFGKEIIGGMLDVDHRLWRKPKSESFQQHKDKVLRFADWWRDFDWTRT